MKEIIAICVETKLCKIVLKGSRLAHTEEKAMAWNDNIEFLARKTDSRRCMYYPGLCRIARYDEEEPVR